MEELESETQTSTVDPRVALSKKIALLAIILSLIFSAFTVGSLINNSNDASSDSTGDFTYETGLDPAWVPSNFTVWSGDSNIAYRWTDKANCDNYGCVQAEFMSKNGCPNGFYAAVNWLDSNDSVISYDNSTLPSLNALQTAKLRFDDVEGSGKSAQIAEISCR